MANVTALLSALRSATEHNSVEEGLQGDTPGRYTLYLSDHEAHSSIYRAAELLNLGRSAVRLVPSGADFRMDVEALEAFLEADLADGHVPFCVVGQAGSFNVSAIDPLAEIADVCAARDLWFHVDGACGAVAAMVPELADRYAGMERADSVTLDPHKFLSVLYECGAVLVRGFDDLETAFSMEASYLRGSGGEAPRELDFFSYGPQTSRGFRALKFWMMLRHHGLAGYRELLRKNVACAAHLDGRVRDHGDFLAVQEPNLYIYSFRYVPADLRPALDPDHPGHGRVSEYLGELAGAVVEDVVTSGLAFLGTTTIRGRRALRTSICSHRTTFGGVDTTFDALAAAGNRLDGAWREDASLPV